MAVVLFDIVVGGRRFRVERTLHNGQPDRRISCQRYFVDGERVTVNQYLAAIGKSGAGKSVWLTT